MKRQALAVSLLTCMTMLSACSTKPPAKPSLMPFEQLNIADDDSLGLKVLKAARLSTNSQDVEIDSAELEKINGTSGSGVALNAAVGTAGLGMYGGNGISGGLLNVGVMLLGSTSKRPHSNFSIIQVIPKDEVDVEAKRLVNYFGKDVGTGYKLHTEDNHINVYDRLVVTGLNDRPYTLKDAPEWSYLMFTVAIKSALLNAEQLNKIFDKPFSAGEYYVVSSTVATCADPLVMDKLKSFKSQYQSYMYVPPKNPVANRKCTEVDEQRVKYQQVIDLNSGSVNLLLKPKAAQS